MLHPGVIYKGDGSTQLPAAVVTESRGVLADYLARGPVGAWVWVRELDDIPEEPLGGLVLLDGAPMDAGLRDALVRALLR